MKKIGAIVCVFLCCCDAIQAQQYDKYWILGRGNYYTSPNDTLNGNICFHFEGENPNIIIDYTRGVNFDRLSATISDFPGDSVLFYTNGVTVRNKYNEVMQNGDSLGWGFYMREISPSVLQEGVRYPKAGICLPTDENTRFNYFYTFLDSYGESLAFTKLLYAQVDIAGNILPTKDSVIIWDIISPNISAVRASGNSWWLAVVPLTERSIYLVEITGSSVISKRLVYDNTFWSFSNSSLVTPVFTNDGKKLIVFGFDDVQTRMEIMDFDRCSGKLSLSQKYDLPEMRDSSWGGVWTAVSSPNSRFVYAMCGAAIVQFDLLAEDVKASKKAVAYPTENQYPFPMDFMQGQLAPNGKIYVNSGSTSYAYSVIENPDEEGIACNVIQDIIVPNQKRLLGFPNYPNYRLEPCANVGIMDVSKPKIRTYPNPASTQVWVEYDGIRWEGRSITLGVYDVLGKEIYTKQLPQYSALHNIDVRAWSSGMYFYSIQSDGKEIGSGKFVKE